MRKSLTLSLALGTAFCLVSNGVGAAPAADLWPRWQEHDPGSTRAVDHSRWQAFLKKYMVETHPSGVNRVRYGDVTANDRAALAGYVARLQEAPISTYNRRSQKAYWINLYNALTVKVVLEHFPVGSIKDISLSSGFFSGIFGGGPWRAKLAAVEGEGLSLDDIEHRILRPIWRDNRVHYAVCCASVGCPNLQPEAFTAQNLERLLTHGTRAYVNHPRGVSLLDGRLRVSSIYDWFQQDFGGSRRAVVQHLRDYANSGLREKLDGYDGKLDYHYDWSLNGPR